MMKLQSPIDAGGLLTPPRGGLGGFRVGHGKLSPADSKNLLRRVWKEITNAIETTSRNQDSDDADVDAMASPRTKVPALRLRNDNPEFVAVRRLSSLNPIRFQARACPSGFADKDGPRKTPAARAYFAAFSTN